MEAEPNHTVTVCSLTNSWFFYLQGNDQTACNHQDHPDSEDGAKPFERFKSATACIAQLSHRFYHWFARYVYFPKAANANSTGAVLILIIQAVAKLRQHKARFQVKFHKKNLDTNYTQIKKKPYAADDKISK